ncbi:MAG TPA: CheR family methyltransferase [Herpetosiphonaceae bacterium]
MRDMIHQHTGMLYDDAKRDILASKLSSRVITLGFGSFLDYYYLLKYDDTAHQEWEHVINALSVQETFFWREIAQVQAVVNTIVPLLARTGVTPIRIWSAACATGEEPLTIAMALHEARLFDRFDIQLYASDASSAAIAQAERGLYRERSFRITPPAIRDAYFAPERGYWRIDSAIHKRVSWAVANMINADDIARFRGSSIIFCRNAFIYFSDAMVKRAAGLFWHLMGSQGYLCLGSAESLIRLATDFELAEIDNAFVYVKRSAS